MLKKVSILLFFLLFSHHLLYAEIFRVLNNNDSGVDSFRDAITKSNANGNSEVDYIYFNIPGNAISQHTINLLTGLPEIVTDLVIDANTQPGDLASINGAKVVIEGFNFNDPVNQRIFAVSAVNKFELYGLVIKNFYKDNISYRTGTGIISFTKSNVNVTIGAIGKGNVFFNCGFISASPVPASPIAIQNFIFQNNFYGIAEDGVGITNVLPTKLYLFGVSNAIIGGNTKAEGNLLYGGFEISPTTYIDVTPKPFTVTVKNNIISANINEDRPGITIPRNTVYSGITTGVTSITPEKAVINITDNVFGSSLSISGFTDADVLITKNYFGSSRDLSKKLPIMTQALSFYNFKGKVLVGGSTVAEGNVISNTNDDLGFRKLYPGAVWAENSEKIELSHNSFFCNPEFPFLYSQTGPFAKPLEVFLDNLTSTTVSGRSKPGARIELFYSDPECTNCQPKRYFATVITDANGNWEYPGALESGYSVLAGATLNGVSSEFSDPRIYLLHVGQVFKITPQTCDNPNGKIEGVYLVNVNRFEWLDEANNVVGTTIDLENVKAGKYRLKAYQFGCIVYSDWAIVEDRRPSLSFTGIPNIIQPSCGNPGSILNLYPNNYKDFSWLDGQGNVVGKDRELKNVPPGSYTLHLIGLTDCNKDFGPYILSNVSGPNADFSNTTTTNTNCLTNTGSIKGTIATGSGNLTFKWTNELNSVVGTNVELENVGVGTYKLEIKDESACNGIVSALYKIELANPISMDESLANTRYSACNVSNGFIKGIITTGATSFKWVDRAGNSISTEEELINTSPGDYKLIASNLDGCVKESKFYTITKSQPRVFPDYVINSTDASCNLNNGSVTVNLTSSIVPSAIKWLNDKNELVGLTASVNNLKDGMYSVYFTDENGCEAFYKSVSVIRIPVITVNESAIQINPDICEQVIGSIKNIVVSGGKMPYRYEWKNKNSQTIGSESSIASLAAGNYTLTITDALNCEVKTLSFNVPNQNSNLSTPIIDPISICAPSTINISVKNAIKGAVYRLYPTISSTSPIAEQKDGIFQINPSTNSTYYITQVLGTCESERGVLLVELNGSELKIPNSFSPNNDGINDFWTIPELDKYNRAQINIFNRLGNKIFEHFGPNLKYDGKYKGKKLMPGVYYYTISLSQNCRQFTGSLLIL